MGGTNLKIREWAKYSALLIGSISVFLPHSAEAYYPVCGINLPSNGLTVGSDQLSVSGGKVGIGTGSANSTLDVRGTNICISDPSKGNWCIETGIGGAQTVATRHNVAYSAGANRYVSTGGASQIVMDETTGATGGDITFQTAASGTAGNAITFNNSLVLKGNGAATMKVSSMDEEVWVHRLFQPSYGSFQIYHGAGGIKSTALGTNLTTADWDARYQAGGATQINMNESTDATWGGAVAFLLAPTGAAGSAITWTNAFTIMPSGTVGINTGSVTPPAARLEILDASTTTSAVLLPRAGNFTGTAVNGMIRYNSTSNLFQTYQNGAWVSYTVVSDGRLKTNVESVSNGLDIVNQLRPVFFDWDRNNERTQSFANKHQVGFIAQEVEQVLPEVVTKGADSYRTMEYGNMVAVAVAAIKELYASVMGQGREIASLKAENAELKSRVQGIEAWACSQQQRPAFCK